jgi:pseudaminic acid synthase
MSANHDHDFDQAVKIIKAAKKAGADAIKLQTYSPESMTLDVHNEFFKIEGTIWEGKNLYNLYREAYTPWEWQPKLKKIAEELQIDFFSTPFDPAAVDYLEKLDLPVYKIASFELVDLPLIERIAKTGKPVIMSTGMASLNEIDEAVKTYLKNGGNQIALLKCTSAYPTPPEEMNLRTIPHLAEIFNLPVGISDHTIVLETAIAAVALGACIVEKHFTLSRDATGPDSSFSIEPAELKAMVKAIRNTEKVLGTIYYGRTEKEKSSTVFRRSLFVVQDMEANAEFTEENVKSIRPGFGLHTRHLDKVLGRKSKQTISKGTPLDWDLIV